MNTWTLCATTEQPAERWTDLTTLIHDWRCAWTDLDGLHIDVAPPPTPPTTSHFWAWTSGAWIRARIDHHRWTAGALFHGDPAESPLWRDREPVESVTTDLIRNWSTQPRDGRIAQLRLAHGTVPSTMYHLVPVRPRTAAYIGSADSIPP